MRSYRLQAKSTSRTLDHDESFQSSEVRQYRDPGAANRLRRVSGDRFSLAWVELEQDCPAGRKRALGIREQERDRIEAIRTGHERKLRLCAQIRVGGDLIRTKIRKVRKDEVRWSSQPAQKISGDKLDPIVQAKSGSVEIGVDERNV
jgi:hypothetical protein